MNEKYLIINADDYGSSYGANEATEILFNTNSITSCTIMTPCQWATDGAIRAKKNDKIKIGLHTTLTSEWDNNKWTAISRENVSSLLNDDGYFYPDVKTFAEKADNSHVMLELEAQMNWTKTQGLEMTHVDNHMGTLYGLTGRPFIEEALGFCAKHKKAFRLPRSFENIEGVPKEVGDMISQVDVAAKNADVPILDYLLYYNKEVTKEDTYETVKANYIDVINNIKPGINELYMHPIVDTPDGRAGIPTWQMRVWEFTVLQDKDFKKAIEDNGIKLIGWEEGRKLSK